MRTLARSLFATLGLLTALACAGEGTSFENQDWQLACDNTGTCRAAGYGADGTDFPVSVLFTRAAGAGTAVKGELQLGQVGEDKPMPQSVRLTIDGRTSATVRPDQYGHADLAPQAVAALLKAFAGSGDVAFVAGASTWSVSGGGATSVLLKMDDVQGRVGTPGALVRKGSAREAKVPGPVPAPRVQAVRIPTTSQPGDDKLAARVLASLGKNDDCDLLGDADARKAARLWHLGAGRVLVSQPCWQAAYNSGDGYWVANARPPYDARLVTASGSEFDEGTGISSQQKGRGIGDCFAEAQWTWNGAVFVHSSESTTGMCRGVMAGGAWNLPTVVTEVIAAK